jgi:hypothetical protein
VFLVVAVPFWLAYSLPETGMMPAVLGVFCMSNIVYALSGIMPGSKTRQYLGFSLEDDDEPGFRLSTSLATLLATANSAVYSPEDMGELLAHARTLKLEDIEVYPFVQGSPLSGDQMDGLEQLYLAETLDKHQLKLAAAMG